MRILLINWADVEGGAAHGGGVNGYVQSLALELVGGGHDVACLSSGVRYEPSADNPARPGPVGIQRDDDWRGVERFAVINSPALAPALHQFRRPVKEIENHALEREVGMLLERLRPDIVHFHNIEGLTCGCVRTCAKGHGDWPGARIVYSLHNYHTICPQVYLMRAHRRPCEDYENGHACTNCIQAPRPNRTIARRLGAVDAPQRAPAPDPAPASLEPLTNDIRPEAPCASAPNTYGRRRGAMIDMLNACDRVLAVSPFVRAKFASLGVNERDLVTMPIGTRAVAIACERRASPPPSFDPPRPVRLVFLGYNNYFKGLPMLADSLERLSPEERLRLDLTLASRGLDAIRERYERLGLARVTIRDGYLPEDIPDILGAKDMGVVPSVWWDNAPQTVFEFFAHGVPVLGAAVGGIPDFVHDGVNGVLFRGNDRDDLARSLRLLIEKPATIERLRAGVRPPISMRHHTHEILTLYQGLMAAPALHSAGSATSEHKRAL